MTVFVGSGNTCCRCVRVFRRLPFAKMASTGKKNKKAKSKGKKFGLLAFLSSDTVVQSGYNVVTLQNLDWAEEVEKDAYRRETLASRDKFVLPAGPKGALIDLANIPDCPPYTAFLGNLPFEVVEQDIHSFFHPLTLTSVRLPRPGSETGRTRGFGYAEFHDRESLIKALTLNEQPLKGARIKVDIAEGQDADGNRRRDRVDRGPDRTTGDWRSAREDPMPSRDDSDRGRGYNDRGFDRGNSGDRDRGFGASDYNFRDRDRGTQGDRGSNFPERERDWENVRNEAMTYDQGGGSRGSGRRDFGSGYRGDSDRFSNDRDRYSNDRDRYPSDRDRYQSDRDRYPNDRDRYSNDRDRYGSDRRRDDGYAPPSSRGSQGGARNETEPDRDEGAADGPKERPKLQLKPRSKPIEESPLEPVGSSSIFGGAKPVDTAAKEREIEARLAREREDAIRRVPEMKERKEDSRPDVTREMARKELGERVRRSSASSQTSSQPRSPKTSTSGPPSARDGNEGSNPALSEPEDDRVDVCKEREKEHASDKPLSPRREDTKAVPAPPPTENVWAKRSSTMVPVAQADGKTRAEAEKENRQQNVASRTTPNADGDEFDKGKTNARKNEQRRFGNRKTDDAEVSTGPSSAAPSTRGRGAFRGFGRGGPVPPEVRNSEDPARGRDKNRNIQDEMNVEGSSKYAGAEIEDADK